MEKLIEQLLRVTNTDTWDTWAEFTKDVKKGPRHHSSCATEHQQAIEGPQEPWRRRTKRRRRASEIAVDQLVLSAHETAAAGERRVIVTTTAVRLPRTISRTKYGKMRHMTAAPCLPSPKMGPPYVCTSGGVAHANGAQRATAKHAVKHLVKNAKISFRPFVKRMARTKSGSNTRMSAVVKPPLSRTERPRR